LLSAAEVVVSGIGDSRTLEEQNKIDEQLAANNARQYNPDGSAKANDFVKPKPLQSTFPARLGHAGSELMVNTAQVGTVRTNMTANLKQLEAISSQLVSNGDFGSAVGGWSTADGFGSNTLNAYEAITQFMQDLNSAYDRVTANLAKTVVNYDDTESTIASAASKVGSESAPSGSLEPGGSAG
jgi:hypothetical protein